MNLKITPVLLVAIMALGFVFTSCEKQELKTENSENINEQVTINDLPNLKVEDGMLCFENESQFFETIDLISNLSSDVRIEWEKEIGYVSLKTIQENALDELQDAEYEDEIMKWLDKYQKYFELIENKGEKEIKERVVGTYSILCNENQMYSSNDRVYKYIEDKLIIAPKDKINLLENNLIDESFDVINFVSDSKTGGEYSASAAVNESNCFKGRKVKIRNYIQHYAYFNTNYGRYFYGINVITETKGYRKSSCIWIGYKTELDYKNVHGNVSYNNGGSSKTFNFSNYTSNSDEYSHSVSHPIISGNSTSQSVLNLVKNVYFITCYGEASSRGVGDLWAILKYPNN